MTVVCTYEAQPCCHAVRWSKTCLRQARLVILPAPCDAAKTKLNYYPITCLQVLYRMRVWRWRWMASRRPLCIFRLLHHVICPSSPQCSHSQSLSMIMTRFLRVSTTPDSPQFMVDFQVYWPKHCRKNVEVVGPGPFICSACNFFCNDVTRPLLISYVPLVWSVCFPGVWWETRP